MKGRSEWVIVAQLCLTLCDPRGCSLPGSSVHRILQARILECVIISFSRGISQTQGLNCHLLDKQVDSLWLSHQGSPLSCFNSVQFSHSIVSDSSQPHGLQHARPPCPSPTPRVYSNSCPLSQWCHPTVSSSVIPFSCLQSFPASGSFPMSSLHQVANVLEFQLQHQSFQWLFWTDFF